MQLANSPTSEPTLKLAGSGESCRTEPRKLADATLRKLTAKQRAKMLRREQILDGFAQALAASRSLNWNKKRITQAYILQLQEKQGIVVSQRTLELWQAARDRDGRAGLVDGRSLKSGAIASPEESDPETKPFIDEVKRLWLDPKGRQLSRCHDYASMLALQQGWKTISLSRMRRIIDNLDTRLVIRMREGETAFATRVLPHIQRDFGTLAVNQVWCSDHMLFDVLVNAGTREQPVYCRPWLTSWEDMRSRRIVGHRIRAHSPDSTVILLAFREACLAAGIPQIAYIDNGKDFDAWVLQGQTKWQRRRFRVEVDPERIGGVFGMLDVEAIHANPYNAKAKPIEPWHNQVHARFDKFQASYCGRNAEEKPENLPDILARGQAPMLADFVRDFANWLEAGYNNVPHSGQAMDGLTPAQAFSRYITTKRTAPEWQMDLCLQRMSKPVKAHSQGVTWGERTYGRGDPLLGPWFNKHVVLRCDEADTTVVSVWTEDDKPIGRLKQNDLAPWVKATDELQRKVKSEQKRIKAAVNAAAALGPRRNYSYSDLMHEAAAEARRADEANKGSPNFKAVQTPFNGQQEAVERAFQRPLKMAAGAESLSDSNLLMEAPEAPRQRQTISDFLADLGGDEG